MSWWARGVWALRCLARRTDARPPPSPPGPGDFFWLPEPEILLEITEYAGPCKNQGKFFLPGASFNRINHHVYPGCSRLYTKVVRNGCGIVSQGNVVAAFKGGTGMAPGPEKIE